MKVKELLNIGINELKQNKVEDFIIQAKILLAHFLKSTISKLIIRSEENVNSELEKLYIKSIEELIMGKPLQYITNNQEFMKLNFYVDENVLIPQPDTEILVEKVIEYSKQLNNTKLKILDLCTGSGAIGISLAKNIKNSEIWATDISNKALQIAKLNAEKNLINNQMHFIESDMFKNIKEQFFDVIVSNPPYIETKVIETLSDQVKNEPYIALDGGNDGLKFYKIISENARGYLNSQGKIFLEIGYNQSKSVSEIFEKNYANITCVKDLSNNDRVIIVDKRGE